MFIKKFMSAFINAIITISDSVTLYMPDSDNDFDDFIEDNLVEFFIFFVIQNSYSIISKFI